MIQFLIDLLVAVGIISAITLTTTGVFYGAARVTERKFPNWPPDTVGSIVAAVYFMSLMFALIRTIEGYIQ